MQALPPIPAIYPRSIFLPREICYETEDEDFIRYCDHGRPGNDPFGPVMEIIVEKNTPGQLYGHYLRFYGLHHRARPIFRKLQTVGGASPWFSDDFQEAAFIGTEDKYLLRFQKRALNFYITHLSVSSSDNIGTHRSLIEQVRREFREISSDASLHRDIDTKTRKAIRKLLAVKKSLGQ